MNKFRVKLTLTFVLLIGLSVLASGILLVNLLKEANMEALRDSMQREIQIVLSTVMWQANGDLASQRSYFNGEARRLSQVAGTRITFIRGDGVVLGDSDHDPATMDNHLSRPEIQTAKSSGIGYMVRYSDTIREDMLYAAMPKVSSGRIVGYMRLSMSLADVRATSHQMWTILIVSLAALFLIAGLVSYRIAHRLTRPLEKAIHVAKQITRMNYKSRVVIEQRSDEIGQLGLAINSMADSLQSQMAQINEEQARLNSVLNHMNSGVMTIDRSGKIALVNRSAEEILGMAARDMLEKPYEQVHMQVELTQSIRVCLERKERAYEEITFYYPEERILEVNAAPMLHEDEEWGALIVLHDITAIRRLERMRREFVANVSHELKTPITAIKGFSETLLAGAVKDPELADSFLHIIFDESDRLNRLIEDTLQLSKIETKEAPLKLVPVHLPSFVAKTVDMLSSQAKRKGIHLEHRVAEDLYLEADEDRLQQILINLLSNGLNYTPEGGRVEIMVEPAPSAGGADYDTIRFTIRDTGIGIPKKDLPRIFERFYRVDKARSRSSGGTGLGLSIVKHLVELHHGTIQVDSMVGVGTRFTMDLPVIQQ